MTVVNLKPKKSPREIDIKREEILDRYRNNLISQKDAANELFRAGYSIETAWTIARQSCQ